MIFSTLTTGRSLIVSSFLFSFLSSSSSNFVSAHNAIAEICKGNNTNIPICHLGTVCTKEDTCESLTTLSYFCADPINVNLTSTCTSSIAKPSSSIGILNSTLALQQANSICYEMPNMENCKQCSFPTPNISNCNVLKAYADLCIEMPGMKQCDEWKTFCNGPNKDAAPSICSKVANNGKTSASTGLFGNQNMNLVFALIGLGCLIA